MPERTILHKGYTISLISFKLAEGGWVPEAWVNSSTEEKEQGHPVRDDSIPPLPTRDGANDAAKKLAIQWIDSRVPSAVDQAVPLDWIFDKPSRPGWYWYRERGMNLDFPMPAWVFDQPPFLYVSLFAVHERERYRHVKQVKHYSGEWWGPFEVPK
jgi:hypothetical protein